VVYTCGGSWQVGGVDRCVGHVWVEPVGLCSVCPVTSRICCDFLRRLRCFLRVGVLLVGVELSQRGGGREQLAVVKWVLCCEDEVKEFRWHYVCVWVYFVLLCCFCWATMRAMAFREEISLMGDFLEDARLEFQMLPFGTSMEEVNAVF
jgi:hypothetical protein